MATAKQPQPTAIMMMSSMAVLPMGVWSDAEARQGQGDRKGYCKMQRQHDADLEHQLACARRVGIRFKGDIEALRRRALCGTRFHVPQGPLQRVTDCRSPVRSQRTGKAERSRQPTRAGQP